MRIPFCTLLVLSCAVSLQAEGPLVVHEWGTFTSFQDEAGNAIGGINSDDEPVPPFVHRLEVGRGSGKGVTPCNPEVTMRLETPVVYFYPPADWAPRPINVSVDFHGGWVTEWYPEAHNEAPGLQPTKRGMLDRLIQAVASDGHLRAQTTGRLSWPSLVLAPQGAGPETDSKVWLAPRQTQSAWVQASPQETEKFLFYRGMGHVDAPLQLVRQSDRPALEIHERKAGPHFPAWWVQVNEQGLCAYRHIEEAGELRAYFAKEEFQPGYLAKLRQEMQICLVGAGLFADEAQALLSTWEVSYFKSPGLRLFYLCPREEIEEVLPLKITPAAAIKRVLVGRIEVTTPEQRGLLRIIAAGPAGQKGPFFKAGSSQTPEALDAYVAMGRFRAALLLNEQRLRPTPALADFIKTRNLQPVLTN